MAMQENSCRRKCLLAEEKNRVGVGRGVGSALSFTMRHGSGGGWGVMTGGGGREQGLQKLYSSFCISVGLWPRGSVKLQVDAGLTDSRSNPHRRMFLFIDTFRWHFSAAVNRTSKWLTHLLAHKGQLYSL